MKWRDRLAIYFGISCGLFASATLDQIVNLWGEGSNCAVEPADGYLNLKLLFYVYETKTTNHSSFHDF